METTMEERDYFLCPLMINYRIGTRTSQRVHQERVENQTAPAMETVTTRNAEDLVALAPLMPEAVDTVLFDYRADFIDSLYRSFRIPALFCTPSQDPVVNWKKLGF